MMIAWLLRLMSLLKPHREYMLNYIRMQTSYGYEILKGYVVKRDKLAG
jgi:hypothetical protein